MKVKESGSHHACCREGQLGNGRGSGTRGAGELWGALLCEALLCLAAPTARGAAFPWASPVPWASRSAGLRCPAGAAGAGAAQRRGCLAPGRERSPARPSAQVQRDGGKRAGIDPLPAGIAVCRAGKGTEGAFRRDWGGLWGTGAAARIPPGAAEDVLSAQDGVLALKSLKVLVWFGVNMWKYWNTSSS